ncbi:hypothetical protein HAX54_050464 [Datura stramonium]|uniref:Uncharacterized protein n=1 Tax=Datura stramonium TaxID=4076 RepID=A0ABS8WLE4_DATST|nr:hypothetical protein [Datura stramonium]
MHPPIGNRKKPKGHKTQGNAIQNPSIPPYGKCGMTHLGKCHLVEMDTTRCVNRPFYEKPVHEIENGEIEPALHLKNRVSQKGTTSRIGGGRNYLYAMFGPAIVRTLKCCYRYVKRR